MKLRNRGLSSLLAILMAACSMGEQSEPSAMVLPDADIALRSVSLRVGEPMPPIPADLRALPPSALADGIQSRVLVHVEGSMSSLSTYLEKISAPLEVRLPHHAAIVSVTSKQLETLQGEQEALGIDLLEPYHPYFKRSPEVMALNGDEEEVRLIVHLFQGTDVEATRHLLNALNLQVTGVGGQRLPRVGIITDGSTALKVRDVIARLPEVYWLERAGTVRLSNDEAVPIVQSGDYPGSLAMAERGLYGEEQIIAILDTGLDYDSCFFRDDLPPPINLPLEETVDLSLRKVIAYDFLMSENPTLPTTYDNYGHGTHVAGNALGDNLLNLLEHDSADGMAPGALLVVQDGGYGVDDCADLPALGCPVVDLLPFFAQAYAQGARIHTNSWGDNENGDITNSYSSGCEDVDTFVHSHPDFLLLFAAGNSGPATGSVNSPSTAKNAISVGGTQNGSGYESLYSVSSRGPTADGRLKPDVLAPAINTSADSDRNVTTNNCASDSGGGTSYATPLVAGAAALLREYFVEGYYPSGVRTPDAGFEPSAALLKAALIHSARGISGATSAPSPSQGFGRVALEDVLYFSGDAGRLLVYDGAKAFATETDSPFIVTVRVTDSSRPLRVTLVWTDPPSTPAAAVNLVNNLDLEVSYGRRTYLGNVFLNGRSVTGGQPDALNNVEAVLLGPPTPGFYTVRVVPREIADGPQDFALVVSGGFSVAP